MRLFAVTRQAGPAWDAGRGMREQSRWAEHAAFMDELAEDGFVVCGGPLAGSGEAGPVRALLMVRAEGESEIRSRLEEDPWTSMGLLITTIQSWDLVLGTERTER